MRRAFSWVGAAVLVGVLALPGCGGKQPVEETIPPTGSRDFMDDSSMDSSAIDSEMLRDAQSKLTAVYFDYDRWDLREDARATLRSHVETIRRLPQAKRVVVEGHCDERGTEEYNLALGERRAESVRKYMMALGVPDGRLTTVSLGEEQPAVRGHDESAWRWNRRAEFRISN